MIKLQCRCGHVLSLPDALSGQKIRCKRCSRVMRVPSSQARAPVTPAEQPSAELLVQGSRPCPGCGRAYPPSVVVCVDCGLNIDSGVMLYASAEDSRAPEVEPRRSAGWLQRLLDGLGLGKGG